jgi:hypothetical protein
MTKKRGSWSITHGHGSGGSPEYRAWKNMLTRCLYKCHKDYHRYGGRGITVCERWRTSFANFLADMGLKPSPKHSIDRIDGSGNYEPSNCRWATQSEQMSNTSRNVNITFRGMTRNLSQWCELLGVSREMVRGRLARGWTVERAFTTPKTTPKQREVIHGDT